MLEPGSFRLHLRLLKKLFGCQSNNGTNADDQAEIEPINMLFNSTVNIEFVYVILEGIVKFSSMSFKSDNSIEL